MAEIISKTLSEALSLHEYFDSKFKTMRFSLDMLIPLARETASEYALLPAVLSNATRKHPTYTQLSKKLAYLYGASLSSGVSKLGNAQVLGISVEGISEKYAFGHEKLQNELSGILAEIISDPLLDEKGLFSQESFEQEKRQLAETLEAEYNDKAVYARKRAFELMFVDDSAGLSCYGNMESVMKLENAALGAAFKRLLETARFEVFSLGGCSEESLGITNALLGRGQKAEYKNRVWQDFGEPREICEEQDIVQSKLVMLFKTGCVSEAPVFRVMCAVLGGTPSAKLFLNVREKLSLCYYCSSRFDVHGNIMSIESGVQTKNLPKAKEAILEQLHALQNGEVTDEEITAAKLSLLNLYRNVKDSLKLTESWYLAQIFSGEPETPETASEKILKVSREDIVRAANMISLCMTYTLKGRENV